MSLYLFPGFQSTGSNQIFSASILLGVQSGSFDISGSYFLPTSGSSEGISYQSFLWRLTQRASELISTFASQSAGQVSASLNSSNHIQLTGSGLTGSFSIRPLNSFTANLLGAVSGVFSASSAAQFLEFGRIPYYMWISSKADRSNWKKDYISKPRSLEMEADDGTTYSIRKSGSVTYADWRFQFEAAANTRNSYSLVNSPFTWERFIDHAGSIYPILLFTGSSLTTFPFENKEHVYRIRAENDIFEPINAMPNYEGLFHIDIKTRVII